ncbi:hypothetical protein D3C87_324750 [compost metagenome]
MIEIHEIFNEQYEYARLNGYHATHDDYVRKQYSVYGVICVRNGITPMNWYYWLQSQKKG